ncbi:hypothetical protein H4R18_003050 [Coemansia javaensis]|uniref:Glutathione S-transferase n=1 Tax=Coemansia javaensis TaxID=2761396 RepID=A0A9W8HDC1_9FUNG|nr:hypothetical protein H4R18_003050 [Coemansia javaensis]
MSAAEYPHAENGYTLYSWPTCPYAQRAIRALSAAKVPYALETIDLNNKPAWYSLVNPRLKVPALRTPDGTVLIESLVIAEYIAEQFPEAGLLPGDPLARAQLRLFIERFDAEYSPPFYRALRAADKAEQEEQKRLLLAAIRGISAELERQWARPGGAGGPFWAGDRWTYAEVVLSSFLPQLASLDHYRGFSVPETDEYAAFHRWRQAIWAHPEFVKANPDVNDIIKGHKKFVPGA